MTGWSVLLLDHSFLQFEANHYISRQTVPTILMICLHYIFTIVDQHEDASTCTTTSPDALQKKIESLLLPGIQSQLDTHSFHSQVTVLTHISHFCTHCVNCKHGNFTRIN